MEDNNNIRTDKPSAELRELFFGSIDQEKYLKRQWKGGFEPDIDWLNKPLERGHAKEFCTGCGSHSEVTEEHIDRIFGMINRDPKEVDWRKSYLELNACDFCIWTVPEKFMISVAVGKLFK